MIQIITISLFGKGEESETTKITKCQRNSTLTNQLALIAHLKSPYGVDGSLKRGRYITHSVYCKSEGKQTVLFPNTIRPLLTQNSRSGSKIMAHDGSAPIVRKAPPNCHHPSIWLLWSHITAVDTPCPSILIISSEESHCNHTFQFVTMPLFLSLNPPSTISLHLIPSEDKACWNSVLGTIDWL